MLYFIKSLVINRSSKLNEIKEDASSETQIDLVNKYKFSVVVPSITNSLLLTVVSEWMKPLNTTQKLDLMTLFQPKPIEIIQLVCYV